MTSKEVQAAEPRGRSIKTDSTLQYRRRFFNTFPVSIKFTFVKDQLAGAQYIFTERHVRAQQHWEDYEAVAAILKERYGPPSGDYSTWNSPLYQQRPDRFGDAVLLGHLIRSTVWETPRTIITLEMSGKPTEGIYTVMTYAKKSDI